MVISVDMGECVIITVSLLLMYLLPCAVGEVRRCEVLTEQLPFPWIASLTDPGAIMFPTGGRTIGWPDPMKLLCESLTRFLLLVSHVLNCIISPG